MNKSTSVSAQTIYLMGALILVFLAFSRLHETITSLTGLNSRVLYILTPIVLFGVIVSKGLQRAFRAWPGRFWMGVVIWMVLAVPFSIWKGGSAIHVFTYIRTEIIMFPVAAGLITRWVHCRAMLYTIAMAALVNLSTASLFSSSSNSDRLSLELVSLIGNANDLAAHLLLVLPFLLFIVLKPRIHFVFRFISLASVFVGLFKILRTGSRGALLAIGGSLIFMLVRGPRRLRVALGTALPVVLVIFIAMLPGYTRKRLTSFSGNDTSTDAAASREAREYLLRQSIIYTLQHPIFGVGPGQFMIYEYQIKKDEGLRGAWHQTHNSYTQISSECGIPCLLFYLAAVISTFMLLGRIRRRAKAYGQKEILAATFCITLGLVGYSIAAFFVNFGYFCYFPTISGLVVGIWYAVRHDPRFQLTGGVGTISDSKSAM